MKKLIVLLWVVAMSLLLIACGNQPESQEAKELRIERLAKEWYMENAYDDMMEVYSECGLNDLAYRTVEFSIQDDTDDDETTYTVIAYFMGTESDDIQKYVGDDKKVYDILCKFCELNAAWSTVSHQFETENGEVITIQTSNVNCYMHGINDSEGNHYQYYRYKDSVGYYYNHDCHYGEDSQEIRSKDKADNSNSDTSASGSGTTSEECRNCGRTGNIVVGFGFCETCFEGFMEWQEEWKEENKE